MTMRRLVLALVLLSGCATLPYVGPTGTEVQGERAVCSFYGMAYLPKVRFVAVSIHGADGLAEGETIIVRRAPGQPLHETTFAHELYHFALGARGDGTGDWSHAGPGWKPGGELDHAIALLRGMGL